MVTHTYQVNGMTCGHCVNAVTTELNTLSGVNTVDVELASGKVTVTSDQPLEEQQVGEAIDEAGYELVTH